MTWESMTWDPARKLLKAPILDRGGAVYNVVAYGADPTGGESAQAVRAAVSAMPTSGGVLYFPAGTYTIGTLDSLCGYQCAVYISKPVTIRGAGSGATTLIFTAAAGSTQDLFRLAQTPTEPRARINAELRNFTIRPSPSRTGGSLISIVPTALAEGGLIENVGIEPGSYNGINMNGLINAKIQKCRIFNYSNAGILIANTLDTNSVAATIIDTSFQGDQYNQKNDTAILHKSGGNVIVSNNKVLWGRYGYYCDWQANATSSRLIVSGNTFDGVFRSAVTLRPAPGGTFSNVSISGNVFLVADENGAGAITVPSEAIGVIANVLITGNVFARYGNGSRLVTFINAMPSSCEWCDTFTVTGNQFKKHAADADVSFSNPVSNTYNAGNHSVVYYSLRPDQRGSSR